MPSEFIHFVLTSGDSIAFGTNFLSKGHMRTITGVVKKDELSIGLKEKFPSMTEMLAILLLQASEKCPVTGDFCRLHKDIGNLYDESSAKQVSLRVPIYISKVDHNPHS